MSTPIQSKAARALELAQATRAQLDKHEAVCAERYTEIRETLRFIRAFLTRSVLSLIAVVGRPKMVTAPASGNVAPVARFTNTSAVG